MADKQYHKEGNRLKVVLAGKGGIIRWLARQLDKNEYAVSRWYLNKIQPSIPQLQDVSKILDIYIIQLLTPTKENSL